MDRKQFEELMEYLEQQHISKSHRFRKYHPLEYGHLLDIISEMSPGYIRHSRKLPERPDRIDAEYVESVHRTLRISNDIAREIGMLEVLEEYGDLIIAGMEINDIPHHDIAALERLGEANPRGALLAAFLKIKASGSIESDGRNELSVEERLEKLERILSEAHDNERSSKSRKHEADERRPKRRWFKGLGKVAQGSALTLADVGLAAGVLVLPVDPATQTWGAIVSSVTGVGTALDGFGELRGE
jgi:hypothetical protein